MHVKTASDLSGRTAVRIPPLDRLARAIVDAAAAPAAVCAAAYRNRDGWNWAAGSAGTLWPIADTDVTPDVVFDLASVTKPFIAVAAATESIRGRIDWSRPLHELLPELAATHGGQATLEELISHRSGLLPHVELFRHWYAGRTLSGQDLLRNAARAVAAQWSPQAPPQAVYSDLGYLVVGAALEHHFQLPLDAWLSKCFPQLMQSELGSVRQWATREPEFLRRCAPTESVSWRGGLVWGRVHDENAWVHGGLSLSGHAGLFGTAMGVMRFGAAVVDALRGRDSVVPARAARLTTKKRSGGSLRAGFDGKAERNSSAGSFASEEAFGHLGYTGTSLWCDPNRELVVVVLTNRVCPSRDNVKLRNLRSEIHEALFLWAYSKQSAQST